MGGAFEGLQVKELLARSKLPLITPPVVGIEALKPLQREAIWTFALGRDVFVCLPTGFGKSLCYALLPLVFDSLRGHKGSIALCLSPLMALMMEQRSKFTVKGIRAEFVGQLQHAILALTAVKHGKFQLLYVSPECMLSNPQWKEMLLLLVYQSLSLLMKLTA